MQHLCHFCDGDHDMDEEGAAVCRPKRRFKGAIDAVQSFVTFGHPANCECERCVYARVNELRGRIHFLGEPPDPDFVALLLRRLAIQGWPA